MNTVHIYNISNNYEFTLQFVLQRFEDGQRGVVFKIMWALVFTSLSWTFYLESKWQSKTIGPSAHCRIGITYIYSGT